MGVIVAAMGRGTGRAGACDDDIEGTVAVHVAQAHRRSQFAARAQGPQWAERPILLAGQRGHGLPSRASELRSPRCELVFTYQHIGRKTPFRSQHSDHGEGERAAAEEDL